MPIGTPLTACWLWDNSAGAYVDNTVEAQSDGGTAFAAMEQAADRLYFGFARRFEALMFALSVTGSYTGAIWEYGTAPTTWVQFVPVRDYSFGVTSDYMLWDFAGSTVDSAWVSHNLTGSEAAAPPDTTARYWVRVCITTTTTVATVNSIVCKPYTTYATVADVSNKLQLPTPISATTTPTDLTVEDYIRGAEDEMDYQLGQSWRVNFIEEELRQFNQYGMILRNRPVIDLYEVAIFDGNSFDVKTQGRNEEWHIDRFNGIVHISTIWLAAIPPTFSRRYTRRREQGSFAVPVRARYSWGHDFRRHRFAHQINRVAAMKACIELVSSMDFAPLVQLGLDNISLQVKLDNWQTIYQEFIERFSKLYMV